MEAERERRSGREDHQEPNDAEHADRTKSQLSPILRAGHVTTYPCHGREEPAL